VRKKFEGEIPHWVNTLPKVQNEWSSLLQTLDGHTDLVCAVAFSHNGKMVASASKDRTVQLWDTATGTAQQMLKGHTDWVRAVAFSNNSKMLASASDDRPARLWDIATGTVQQTLKDHRSKFNDISILLE
jgi:WD40 repeat protein